MKTISHPYEPSTRIPLAELLDLIEHEIELIELSDDSSFRGIDLLNDVVRRTQEPAEREVLVNALKDRFI